MGVLVDETDVVGEDVVVALLDADNECVAEVVDVVVEVTVGGMLHARKLSNPSAVVPFATIPRPTVRVCVPPTGTV